MKLRPLPALLTLLALTGCRPSPQARPSASSPISFRDVTPSSGITFRLGHPSLQGITIASSIGHGCAFLDYDGDGKPDVLLVGNGGARLYHNEGANRFTDVTAKTLPPPPPYGHFLGCSVADYDADGRPDILLTGYGSTALYHNEGGTHFKDVTAGSGLEARGPYDWTTSAAWADVDGDGKLDLAICRYVRFTPASKQLCAFKALDGSSVLMACSPTEYPAEQGSLYHNEGGGHFRDITREAGLSDTHGNGLGCLFCDYDNDGTSDLYIANDVKPGDLYKNLGGGKFVNVGAQSGTAFGADGSVQSGMGLDWGDYDNDGRFDLLVANFAGQPKSLYHNEGKGIFTNVSYASGIGAASQTQLAFGASFVDVDNDGLLDIVFTNGHVQSMAEKIDSTTSYFQSSQLFHNIGGGRFKDVSGEVGPDFAKRIVGRGMAVGDMDGDGREDLLIVNDEGAPLLLHNESTASGHWLTLRCLWKSGHTDAVGARVTAQTPTGKQIAEVRAGGSYLSANAPEVHFGLGAATSAAVTVRWPGGRTTAYGRLVADRGYRLEGARVDEIR